MIADSAATPKSDPKNFEPESWLPGSLADRCRFLKRVDVSAKARSVVYWMRTAMRVEENPALSVAARLAEKLKLPLLVYQGLSPRYPYASDRHHTFILEGVCDVRTACLELGIGYAFHLERPEDDGAHLATLAEQAAVLVTEDMPTRPACSFLNALRRRSDCTLIAVDTACVVPMRLIGRAYTRAFEFREATSRLYRDRISQEVLGFERPKQSFDLDRLPFEAVDPGQIAIPELVAQCEIDHTIGPVLDTKGGSSAGYRRWDSFKTSKLKAYSKLRNNPLVDGVSRLSAYLHYGMISPMRIAREAAGESGEGAEKFLDELLIWRELAYSYCYYRNDHERWSTLPAWARETLRKHAQDKRSTVYDWERLARGRTDDPLWNAAQASLLIHGELHNNLRMTWGKALLNWTSSPQAALQLMIDLNHRYALDGRDPASYGGILWCLGQFDRPFQPDIPIIGTVRPRPTDEHARRLNVPQYAERTARSRSASPPRIAVVGAGVSGAMVARTLADHGLSVTVFDKSRGVGGRMATRKNGDGEFDHGAQYFTIGNPVFKRYVEAWVQRGIVAPWTGRIVAFDQLDALERKPAKPNDFSRGAFDSVSRFVLRETPGIDRYVAVPSMTNLVKHLVAELDVRLETSVTRLEREGNRYALTGSDGTCLGSFDRVVVAIPAPQAAVLLRSVSDIAEILSRVTFDPCWCVMLQLESNLPFDWNGAFVNGSPLRWIARNQSKPLRHSGGERLVLHATPEWSTAYLESTKDDVCSQLIEALQKVVPNSILPITFAEAHRWRYSIPKEAFTGRCVSNDEKSILACGDWAGGPKIEGAFLSGCAAAGRILGTLPAALKKATQPSLFDLE